MTPQEMLHRFVQLEKDKRAAAEALKAIEDELKGLQEPLQDHFVSHGIQNVKMGGFTVSIYHSVKVRPHEGKTTADVVLALRESGYSELVNTTYHWKQLQSTVNALIDNEEDLPPDLEEVVGMKDEYSVRARRSV